MSSIVYQKNKKTGIIYAYESTSFRDPVSKKPKSKRTYLGRVDPDTNRIIPKAGDGKRNRSKHPSDFEIIPNDVLLALNDQQEQIKQLQLRVDELSFKNKECLILINKIKQLLSAFE